MKCQQCGDIDFRDTVTIGEAKILVATGNGVWKTLGAS